MTTVELNEARELAGFELNALGVADVLPAAEIGGSRVGVAGTTVYDVDGEPLFYRVPMYRGNLAIGYTDLAADQAMGEPLLAATYGADWHEKEIKYEAMAMADELKPDLAYNQVRFVAYSYPKVAVQFLRSGEEMLMLEWGSWAEVPPLSTTGRSYMEPGNFERWSYLDEMPTRTRNSNERAFRSRSSAWSDAADTAGFRGVDPVEIEPETFPVSPDMIVIPASSGELHFSSDSASHHPCFELEGQATPVWCVAASVQMLLRFWRYDYTQVRIAKALGLGTLKRPKGLPYGRRRDVVAQLEALSSNALSARMIENPTFNAFKKEIIANRPVISFVPGHSRTVIGYFATTMALPRKMPFRGLLVYDPWPPGSGSIHRFENFNAQRYQFAYHARVPLV